MKSIEDALYPFDWSRNDHQLESGIVSMKGDGHVRRLCSKIDKFS